MPGQQFFTRFSGKNRKQRPQDNLGKRGIFLGERLSIVQLLSNEHSFQHPQDYLLQESYRLPRWWPRTTAKRNFTLQYGHISPTRVGIQHVQGADAQLARVWVACKATAAEHSRVFVKKARNTCQLNFRHQKMKHFNVARGAFRFPAFSLGIPIKCFLANHRMLSKPQ